MQLYIVKDTKLFDFQFLIPPTYNTAKYVFPILEAIAIVVFCVQLVKQLFLYIYKEVSGAFSGNAYFFNNIISDLVLLFQKKQRVGIYFTIYSFKYSSLHVHKLKDQFFKKLRNMKQNAFIALAALIAAFIHVEYVEDISHA